MRNKVKELNTKGAGGPGDLAANGSINYSHQGWPTLGMDHL